MTSLTTYQLSDLNEHKRKVFFERLSPKTTKDSLEEYISLYEIELCKVPYKEGKSQGHAFVIFSEEESVNDLMLKRPHKIDGQVVELYRSVPGQGSLKEKKGVKNLIVSGIKNGLVRELDLKNYFSRFGTINRINMNDGDNSSCIEFDDYDAVDKALLYRPHIVRNIEVHLTKDPQILSVNIPNKIYCVHIKNIPSNADAEILSMKFSWPIENIVMNSSSFDNQSLPIECWLKGIDERPIAEDFVQRWNRQEILRSKIQCEVEEDKLEFCNKFRIGTCQKKSDVCDWEHITCTANGKCSNNCAYGHKEGMKPASINYWLNETYRIQITGFQKKLTPNYLTEILCEKKCYVNRHQDRVGYIVQVKTMKYARRLMAKLHKKTIDGQNLQCQIQLDSKFPVSKPLTRSGSISNLDTRGNDSHRLDRNRHQFNSTSTSQETSISKENLDPDITTLNDQEFNNEGRIFDRSLEDIIKQKHTDTKRKSRSVELVSLSCLPKPETSNEVSDDSRKITVIRKKTDHGSLAVLIEYKNSNEMYCTELNALRLLKGVKGVVQLIEQENLPNNHDPQSCSTSNCLEIVTEHTPGYSLNEFINRIHPGGFGVLTAVQLVQNLIAIVKQVHNKGVLHQNLGPDNIIIEWDSKHTPVDQARLILINFSQAYIKSGRSDRIIQSTVQRWYKAPQSNAEALKYSSTIDASGICAILLWLLTNIEPRHDSDQLPHVQPDVEDKINKKIIEAIRIANLNRKQVLKEIQLKTYLIDTFNIGFGYPQRQLWSISDLECRLESIHELLSPRNPKMDETEPIFQDLLATTSSTITIPTASVYPNVDQDIFQRAANAFQIAKTNFSEFNGHRYTWAEGSCAWLDSTETSTNERRHDDILTYFSWKANQSSHCSVIITCLAAVDDNGNSITLSIGNTVNGKMSRIPIGRYGKNQNYINEFEDAFIIELKNLIISICKERRAIL